MDLSVDNMSCGHCVAAVTRAVQGVDPGARVEVDLERKAVHVESDAQRARVVAAIVDAGYPAR